MDHAALPKPPYQFKRVPRDMRDEMVRRIVVRAFVEPSAAAMALEEIDRVLIDSSVWLAPDDLDDDTVLAAALDVSEEMVDTLPAVWAGLRKGCMPR